MTRLLEYKEKVKQYYASYGMIINPVLKFILALIIFRGINSKLNYVEGLSNVFITLVLALICSLLPTNGIVVVAIGLFLGQCWGIGMEAAVVACVITLILFIFFIRFAPKDGLALLLTPLAFIFKIPCIIPIGYGLTRKPESAASVGSGVVLYYFIEMISEKAPVLQGIDKKEVLQKFRLLIDGLIKNKEMMMNVIAFVAVLILVSVISKLAVDYAWRFAIFGGAVSYLVIMAGGGLFIDVDIKAMPLILGAIGAIAIGLVLEFFLFGVDYTRSEVMQYEDDEYCYYVKAVPKMKITEKDKKVKHIGGNDRQQISGEKDIRRQEDDYLSDLLDDQKTTNGENTLGKTMDFTGMTQNISDIPEDTGAPVQKPEGMQEENIDFEKKLENELKEL